MTERKQHTAQIIEQHRGLEGPLLPILHAIQEQFGFIPADLEADIARALNLSAAEVRGVVSFYHDFRSAPSGRHQVKICCAEACQARGSRALATHAEQTLGIGFGATTPDDAITLDKVYCLGNCACGPSMMVDGEVYGLVDAEAFDGLLAELTGAPQ